MEFLLRFGGAELHLSDNPRDTSPLVQLVGRDKARALADRAARDITVQAQVPPILHPGQAMAGGDARVAGAFQRPYRSHSAHDAKHRGQSVAQGRDGMTADGHSLTVSDPQRIAAAIAFVRECRRKLITMAGEVDHLLQTLEGDVKGSVKPPFEAPSTPANAATEHRRNHRRGTLAKLDTDPDLRAFVTARLETHTFDDIVAQVAATFPPNRRVSRSSLWRWWIKNRAKA